MGHVAPNAPQVSRSLLFLPPLFYCCSQECVNRTPGCLGRRGRRKGGKERIRRGENRKKREGRWTEKRGVNKREKKRGGRKIFTVMSPQLSHYDCNLHVAIKERLYQLRLITVSQ